MKKIIFAFLLMIVAVSLAAQDCVYEKNELDKFSKEKIVRSKPAILWVHKVNGNNLSVVGRYEKSREWLEIKYLSSEPFSLAEGQEIIFLFKDQSTLALKSNEAVTAEKTKDAARWTALFSCNLDEASFSKLSSGNFTDIRITTAEGNNFDKPISADMASRLPQMLKCLRAAEKAK